MPAFCRTSPLTSLHYPHLVQVPSRPDPFLSSFTPPIPQSRSSSPRLPHLVLLHLYFSSWLLVVLFRPVPSLPYPISLVPLMPLFSPVPSYLTTFFFALSLLPYLPFPFHRHSAASPCPISSQSVPSPLVISDSLRSPQVSH